MKLNFNDIIKVNYLEEIFIEEEQLQQIFANGLKRIRKFYKFKLKDISQGTEIPITTIIRYENAENTPSLIQALKFSYFYKISIETIFEIGFNDDLKAEELLEEIEERNKQAEELKNKK